MTIDRLRVLSVGLIVSASILSLPARPEPSTRSAVPVQVRALPIEVEGLNSSNPAERAATANYLGALGKRAASAVPLLENRLGDERALEYQPSGKPTTPGREAALALGRIGTDPAIKALISALLVPKTMHDAAEGLGISGSSDAVDPLIALIENQPWPVSTAATALGRLKDVRAVQPLITSLSGKPRTWIGFQRRAAWALGELGDIRAIDSLVETLYDKDQKRQAGMEGSYEIQSEAALALGKIGDRRGIEHLALFARKDMSNVSVAAGRALTRIDFPEAREIVMELICGHASEEVRRGMAWEIRVQIESRAGMPTAGLRIVDNLLKMLASPALANCTYALEVLQEISDESIGADLKQWIKWRSRVGAPKGNGTYLSLMALNLWG